MCDRKSAPVTADGDTPADTAVIAIEEPESLPDTALASVEAVKYTVEIADPAVSGSISPDTDYYASAPERSRSARGRAATPALAAQSRVLPER